MVKFTGNKTDRRIVMEKEFIPKLRFMVVSDIHIKDEDCIEEERFRSAISYAYSIARKNKDYDKLDALVIVGDFATSGTEIQMKKARKIIDECADCNETRIIASIASHETNHDGYEVTAERLRATMKCEPDEHTVINGFHFVSCSPSHSCRYDEGKQKWMAAELEKAAEDDFRKPIFVFQHPHNTDTVYGSMLWGEDDLMPIYVNYPQIIHFSGHSHAPINSPRSIHQHHFTSLGTGTLSYFEMDEFDKICKTFPEGKEKAAQMLIVEADEDNRVRVYPFDVITGNFFPYVWKIDTPSDPSTFIYTNARRFKTDVRPRFTDDAMIEFSDITDSSFRIDFTQAVIDEDYVNAYDINVINPAGRIVKRISIWSDYYYYDMPATRYAVFDGLKSGTEYTVEITASGFWFNFSANKLTGKTKTL